MTKEELEKTIVLGILKAAFVIPTVKLVLQGIALLAVAIFYK